METIIDYAPVVITSAIMKKRDTYDRYFKQ